MGYDPGMTQALALSACGLLMLLVTVIGVGPLVDQFVYLGGSFEMSNWGQSMMPEILIYAEWFYLIIRIIGVVFVIWPFIYLFRRHRYGDPNADPMQDELWG